MADTTSANYAPGTLRNPITLEVVNGGVNWVWATISNACGQSYHTPDYPIYAGSPVAFNLIRASNESCDINYHKIPFEIYNYTPLLDYNFQLVGSIPGAQISMQTYNNNPQWGVKVPKAYTGGLLVSMTASNRCGTYTAWYDDEVLANCSNLPQDKTAGTFVSEDTKAFKAYPNPSSDVININVLEKGYATAKNTEAEIFDLLGQSKGKVQLVDGQAKLNVSRLKKGICFLKINNDDDIETHRMAVE